MQQNNRPAKGSAAQANILLQEITKQEIRQKVREQVAHALDGDIKEVRIKER